MEISARIEQSLDRAISDAQGPGAPPLLGSALRYGNWNLDTAFFHANPTMLLHAVDTPEHSNPNTSGTILVRNYLDLTPVTQAPHVIVRDVASGCAYPASMVSAMNILTTDVNRAMPG